MPKSSNPLLYAFVPFTLAFLLGCQSAEWYDLVGEPPDVVPGVTPPSVRIEQLRQLADEAASRTPEQREKVAQELSGEIVHEKDAMIRAHIVRTLASYPTETGRAVMRRALRDPDRLVRMAACDAWGQVGDSEAVERLGKTLERDADVDVRLAAVRALGRTREPSAVAALGGALDDKDPAMQYRAMESLAELTGENLDSVSEWRQYVASGRRPERQPTSVAERWFDLF